jgi:transketolase
MSNLVYEKKSMRDIYGEELSYLAQTDPRVYVLDGDLANSTNIKTVEDDCPDKFLQMGIAEQNMVGVAAGLASVGLQPWATSFATFLTKRALDQILVTVSQPGLDVKLVGAYTGLLNGKAGKTHQSIEDISIMRSLAKMTIFSPADTTELAVLLKKMNEIDGPVYLRMARDPVHPVFSEGYEHDPLKAVKVKDGSDITIISTGTQTGRSLVAAKELEKEGISAAVLHIPTIKPLDVEAIVEEAKRTGAIVTTEDHSIYGGFGSAVAEVVSENYPVPVLRLGIDNKNVQSGSNDELLEHYGLSIQHVKEKVNACLRKKRS